jgi:protein-export membrane protein SecD
MARRNGIIFLIILVIFAFTLWVLLPIDSVRLGRKGLHLGLDFAGGVQVAYQAQFSENTTASEKSTSMKRVITVIQKRIDAFGVAEPEILKLGDDGILVRLPGFTDLGAAEKLVGQTGFLEFRVVEKDSAGNPVYLSSYISGNTTVTGFIDTKETGDRLFINPASSSDTQSGAAMLTRDSTGFHFTDMNGNPISTANLTKYSTSPSWIIARGDDGTPLTGGLLSDAQPNLQSATTGSQPVVDIKWNSEGSDIFNQIAARIYDPQGQSGAYNLIHVLGIFLDNNRLSAPKVNSSSFSGGQAVIEGNFTMKSATELADLLKSGSLPVEIKKQTEGEKMISPTLGIEFKTLSWKAGLIGLLLVMLFMTAYYRMAGFMSSLALVFYVTLMMAIFKLWPITLSLGDIGGFVVSIGIAVDANVLIFERMKEEFRSGRTLGAATEAGFHRAWSAIWDSNVTTFIACIILIWLGGTALNDTTVIGFGVTLFIGAIVSMFTAVTVTRTLLRMSTGGPLANYPSLFITTGGKK